MRVFVTGATGFIGSRIVPELLANGHQVLGLTRSDEGARRLAEQGAQAWRGTLEEPDGLARGADQADAVIHTAFDHDFSHFVESTEKDGRVIEAIGEVLVGSDRPFLITSGVGMGSPGDGGPAREDVVNWEHPNPRRRSELAGRDLLERGVFVAIMRLSQIHDTAKQGLITPAIAIAREKGVSAYVGEGANRWSAAHVDDTARLFRLALEGHAVGARWHAVDEEGVPMREVAEVVGAGLGTPVRSLAPEEAQEHFGWMAGFAGMDMLASSALTRERLGWRPAGPKLLDDLRAMDYSAG